MQLIGCVGRYYVVKATGSTFETYMGVYTYESTSGSHDLPSSQKGRLQLLSCEYGLGSTFSDVQASTSCQQQCETRKSLQAMGLVAWYTGCMWSIVGIFASRRHRVVGPIVSLVGVLCLATVLALFGYGKSSTETMAISDDDNAGTADSYHANYGVCSYQRDVTTTAFYVGVYPVNVKTRDNPDYADSIIIGITAVCLGAVSTTASLALALFEGDYTPLESKM